MQKLGVFMLSADVLDGIATLNTTRNTGVGAAEGETNGNVLAGAMRISTALPLGNFSLLPAAGLRVATVSLGALQDMAQQVAFDVTAQQPGSTSLRPDLNLTVSRDVIPATQLVIRPSLLVGVEDELGDPGQAVSVAAADGTVFAASAPGLRGAPPATRRKLPGIGRRRRSKPGCGWSFEEEKESSHFLKKAAQKLLLVLARGAATSTAQINKVFLLLFVHKKKRFSMP